MRNQFVKQIKIAAYTMLILTILTGLIYPTVITIIAQLLFPYQANGSIIEVGGRKLGSKLIGQQFSDPRYFWGRPSATTPYPYNAAASGGSNFGPLNIDLITRIKNLVNTFNSYSPNDMKQIPVDLVTTSGSGLDPEISQHAALFQVTRVSKTRNIPQEKVKLLVEESIDAPLMGLFGEPRVNVLELNLKLDNLK